MNKAILAPLAVAASLAVGLAAAPLAISQTSDFVITNADATTTLTLASSASLSALVNAIDPRFVVESANTMKSYTVAPPSSTLLSLLDQTADRIVLESANENRFYSLGYPKELFNDQTPPQISDLNTSITTTTPGNNAVTIVWLTTELVTTTFEYGFTSGVYTVTLTDLMFFRQHEISITDVPFGAIIYYRIRHVDRSGNIAQSDERSYSLPLAPIPPKYMYLPMAQRR